MSKSPMSKNIMLTNMINAVTHFMSKGPMSKNIVSKSITGSMSKRSPFDVQ
jgi:hypothetical protein